MKDRIIGRLIGTVAVVGVLLLFSGVSMIEQAPVADHSLGPYILRAFAGLAVILAAMVGQAVRENT